MEKNLFRARRDLSDFAARLQLLEETADFGRANAGATNEISGSASFDPAEPGDHFGPDRRIVAPQSLDSFQDGNVSPANLLRNRLQDLSAAECVLGRGITHYKRLTPN